MSGSNEFRCLRRGTEEKIDANVRHTKYISTRQSSMPLIKIGDYFFGHAKICVLSDWPAQSPDLNVIKSLKARVSSCRPGNIETL